MKTTKLKKPCKSCPYRIGQPETFYTLCTEKAYYDGQIVHDCHELTDFHTKEIENAGCIGSVWLYEKSIGIKHNGIKDIKDLEY